MKTLRHLLLTLTLLATSHAAAITITFTGGNTNWDTTSLVWKDSAGNPANYVANTSV